MTNTFEQDSNFDSSSSPPFSVTFIISFLISESLFRHPNSPSTTLIFPFAKFQIPYAYFIIVALDLFTALLVKWSYGSSYSLISPLYSAALPDPRTFKEIYSSSAAQETTDSSPLLPVGMSFNLSFSSSFYEPDSKASTFFAIELKQIDNVPGFLLPAAILLLYIILHLFFKTQKNNKQH